MGVQPELGAAEMNSTFVTAARFCEPVPALLSRDRFTSGLLALLTVLAAVFFGIQFQSAYPFQHDFHDGIDSPILATELAGSASDLRGILNPQYPRYAHPDPALDVDSSRYFQLARKRASASLRINTYEDFVFILLYSLFLWQFGRLFAAGDRRIRKLLGITVLLTALFDVMENIGILRVLNTDLDQEWNRLAPYISIPSRIKWTLFGLALLITSRILVRSANPIYSNAARRLLAIGYVWSAILLWLGIVIHDFSDLIALAVSTFSLLVLVNLIALFGPYVAKWFPGRIPHYVEDFCHRKREGKADVAVV